MIALVEGENLLPVGVKRAEVYRDGDNIDKDAGGLFLVKYDLKKVAKMVKMKVYPKTPTATEHASLRARPWLISRRASGLIVAVFRGCLSFWTASREKVVDKVYTVFP